MSDANQIARLRKRSGARPSANNHIESAADPVGQSVPQPVSDIPASNQIIGPHSGLIRTSDFPANTP